MKKHIKIEQLEELSDEQIYKLNKWWKESCTDDMQTCEKHGRCYVPNIETATQFVPVPLMTIGMMIEFLLHENEAHIIYDNCFQQQVFKIQIEVIPKEYSKELCDLLWEAVKEVLEA